MQYTVIIRKHHCENADYQSNCDCPLFRAIREQLPELDVRGVSGHHVRIGELNEYWKFDFDKWHSGWFKRIAEGKLDNYPVTFTSPEKTQILGTSEITFSNPNHEKHPAVLEAQEIINEPNQHEERMDYEDRQAEILDGTQYDFTLNWMEGK